MTFKKLFKNTAKEIGAEDGFIVSWLNNEEPWDFATNFHFISSIWDIFKTWLDKLNNDGLLDEAKSKNLSNYTYRYNYFVFNILGSFFAYFCIRAWEEKEENMRKAS